MKITLLSFNRIADIIHFLVGPYFNEFLMKLVIVITNQ